MIPAANNAPVLYRYICTQRPPAPGAVPKGPVNVEYNEGWMEDAGGHVRRSYGAVEYDHELSENDVEDYELVYESEGEGWMT